MTPARSAAALVLVALFCGAAQAGEFDPDTGYRTDRYRSPVDRPLDAGTRATLSDVDRLSGQEDAALIDVMPARVGYDHTTGRWLLAEPRDNIPGSVWLPEVGRGALEPRIAAYFEGALKRLTAGRPERPLVFYCMADCWMSWNAVKRAASLGYARIYWFAEGSDGWRDADRPLAAGDPWPVPPLGAEQPQREAGRPQ